MAGVELPAGVRPPRELRVREFPKSAADVLARLGAPPRLVGHLVLVHTVALELCETLTARWPMLPFDVRVVELGAALHDVGKVACPQKLYAPGKDHEEAGERMLLDSDFSPRIARFARSHGLSAAAPQLTLDELVVALADSVWKGVRRQAVEDAMLASIADVAAVERWDAFLGLEECLEPVLELADRRLVWHSTLATVAAGSDPEA